MSLVIERYAPEQKGWQQLGELVADGPPGSLSHNPTEGPRELIMFSCQGEHSLITRSIAGVDTEIGLARMVSTVGTEPIAHLEAGQKLELMLRLDNVAMPQRIRFRHQGPA